VLIVDDDRDMRIIGRTILRHFGFDVAEATNAEEARRSIGTSVPDLILTELSLPGEDGWALTRQIRSNAGCATIPIIAITGYLHPNARERAAEAGFSAYLTKPCRPLTIVAEVRRWTVSASWLSRRAVLRSSVSQNAGGGMFMWGRGLPPAK